MLTCAPLVQVTDAALDYLTYYTRFPEANTDGAPCSRPLCPAPRAQLPSTISRTCLCLAPWGGGGGGGGEEEPLPKSATLGAPPPPPRALRAAPGDDGLAPTQSQPPRRHTPAANVRRRSNPLSPMPRVCVPRVRVPRVRGRDVCHN